MKRILLLLALAAAQLFGQVVIPPGTSLNITSGGSVPSGGTPAFGPGSSTDYALAAWNGTAGNLLRNTTLITDANGDLIMPSTATNGLQLYNTADQVTNYERVSGRWSSNNFVFGAQNGGTGAYRTLVLGSNTGGAANLQITGSQFAAAVGTLPAGVSFFAVGSGTNTATSGTSVVLSIAPTYNSSVTAAGTDIKSYRTQTAVGSGAQSLLDLGVGSTSWYWFGTGNTATTGGFNSSNSVEPAVTFAPIINQTGTAGYTALKVNVTQTTTGSGAKLLMDFQADGATKFSVDALGGATLTAASATPRLTLTRTTTNAGSGWIEGGNGGLIQLFTASLVALSIDTVQGTTFTAKAVSISPTAGIGYATGAGGAVTQATDKTTGVTLSKVTGQITMNAASLAAGTSVGFTVTNTAVATTDVIIVNIDSGATLNSYTVTVDAVGAGSFHIHLRNESAGALAEAVVLNFAIIKSVSS